VSEKLNELSVEEIKRLRAYEAENKNPQALLIRFATPGPKLKPPLK